MPPKDCHEKNCILVVFLFAAGAMTACSSSTTLTKQEAVPAIASVPKTNMTLTTGLTGGNLKLTFSKEGQWERISSTSSTKIVGDLASSSDEAVTVATMKARRQIAEFINTEVNSKRTVETISKTIQQSGDDSVNDSSEGSSARIAQNVTDSITQNSRAILKGTVVESEYVDADKRSVTVTVAVDRRSALAAESMTTAK